MEYVFRGQGHSADIVDGSRIAIRNGIPKALRRRVLDGLVVGTIEIASQIGWKACVGVMTDPIWERVYRRRGVPVENLSEPFLVGEDLIRVGRFRTDSETWRDARAGVTTKDLPPAQIRPALLELHKRHAASANT
jgi:N-acyl-L-homoserine lactone synthetase